jgi:hypothetical protein
MGSDAWVRVPPASRARCLQVRRGRAVWAIPMHDRTPHPGGRPVARNAVRYAQCWRPTVHVASAVMTSRLAGTQAPMPLERTRQLERGVFFPIPPEALMHMSTGLRNRASIAICGSTSPAGAIRYRKPGPANRQSRYPWILAEHEDGTFEGESTRASDVGWARFGRRLRKAIRPTTDVSSTCPGAPRLSAASGHPRPTNWRGVVGTVAGQRPPTAVTGSVDANIVYRVGASHD